MLGCIFLSGIYLGEQSSARFWTGAAEGNSDEDMDVDDSDQSVASDLSTISSEPLATGSVSFILV